MSFKVDVDVFSVEENIQQAKSYQNRRNRFNTTVRVQGHEEPSNHSHTNCTCSGKSNTTI